MTSVPTDVAPGTLAAVEQRLDHPFADRDLLALALTHASVGGRRSNERLEFLGDRVLGLAVAELLYQRFPHEAEGALARRLAHLVRGPALALVVDALGLDSHLFSVPSSTDGTVTESQKANLCEALIGALYLDAGLAPAGAFVRRHWTPLMEQAGDRPPKDAKTALQEWAQARGLPLPDYDTVAATGPDHAPTFRVTARVAGHASAEGEGASKRTAAMAAATALLARLRGAPPGEPS